MAKKGRSANVKGKTFERDIVKLFTKNYQVQVNRGAYSGANHLNGNVERSFVGDVFFPASHPLSLFNFELKNHDTIQFSNIIKGNKELPSFLEQVMTDTNRLLSVGYKSIPCLIIKVKRDGIYVTLPFSDTIYTELCNSNELAVKHRLSYNDKRHKIIKQYDVLTTTIGGFMKLNVTTLVNAYKNYDLESLNHNLSSNIETPLVDNLIEEIIENEQKNT